jgi:hypothetical protein
MAGFNILAAKKEGYSDSEIAQYLAEQSGADYQAAISEGYKPKEIISYLNKTGASPITTFLTSAKQEVGSELKGIYQMAGGELDTAAESQRRQMESENPISGVLGSMVGGLINPSTAIPGSLLFKGAKGLVAGGAAAGGIGGFLQPKYEEEDLSRLASTGLGVAGGAAIVGGLLGGAKGLSKVFNKITGAIEEVPLNRIDPTTQNIVNESDLPPGVVAAGTKPEPVLQDSVMPWMQNIADAEERAQAGTDFANGNFSKFFTEAPFRFTETPDFRNTKAFSLDNPYRQENIDGFIKSGEQRLAESENVLKEVVAAWSPQLRSELGLSTDFTKYTPDEAANFMKLRGLEEVAPAEILRVFTPVVEDSWKKFNTISELFQIGRQEGLSSTELNTMFKADLEAIKPFITSSIGNARNAGKALQAQKAIKKAMGGMSPAQVRKYLDSQEGKTETESLTSLMDAIAEIKAAPGTSFDKEAAIRNLVPEHFKNPTWKDKFGEYVVNAYISGLATPAVNAASGIAKLGLVGAERILQTLNPFSQAKLGELIPAFRGMMDGLLEGAYFAKEGFLRGAPLDATMPELRGAIGLQPGASKVEQLIGKGVRYPGKIGVGTDEFFKSIFRKMEYNAQAYRLASSGKYGEFDSVYNALRNVNTKTTSANIKEQLLSIPDLASLPDALRLKLVEDVQNFAKSATFQADLGKFGQSILRFRANHPEMAWVIPFVKTPINIMKDALSYTPLGIFSKSLPNDVKLARTAIGVGIATGLSQLVGSNQITGSYPKDADKRNAMIAAGLPEYSMKIGNTWYSYARVEPLATIMGTVVDGTNALITYNRKSNTDTKKEKELILDVVGGITKNIASKTFLEGISGVMQAIHDPARYGGSFINSFAGLLVPSFVAAPARAQDPNMRVVTGFGEAVQNRIPTFGLGTGIPGRQELPAQSMIYGGERPNPSYGLAAFTGIQTTPAAQTELQQETARIKFDYNLPSKSLKGVELNGEDQSKYQKISSDFADPLLNSIIKSSVYQNVPDSMKRVMLEKAMRRARKISTNMMFLEKRTDPEFMNEYMKVKLSKKGLEEE